MRKAAILTMQRSQNYGAVLQAYALQQAIEGLGLKCQILDLLRPLHVGYKYTSHNAPLESYKNITSNKHSHSLQLNVKNSLWMFLESVLARRKQRRFHKFEQANLQFSPQTFYCSDDLYAAKLDYDFYVTGSDQVWNPNFSHNLEPYFLTFVPPGVPRIAYAPSFGVNDINKSLHSQYIQWLNDITHLSVRETQGAEIIRRLTGRDAKVVLDPTFLLTNDAWRKIAKKPSIKRPYIFCYSLGDVPGLMELCYHVHEVTKFPIYKIGTCKDLCDLRVKAILNAGPQEFLGFIMDAAIVITNSFHGTAFSINMKKNFYTVASPVVGTNSRNSRLFSILDLLGLSSRLLKSNKEIPSLTDFEVSYGTVSTKLAIERENSLSYLEYSFCG